MALDKALKNLKFDNRMTEININNGSVSKEEIEQHLKNLPDSAHPDNTINFDVSCLAFATIWS